MKVGICYRPTIHSEYIEEIIDEIDILEVMPDVMDIEESKFIKKLAKEKNISIGIHTLKSSIASPYGLSEDDVEKYFFASKYMNAVYFSDHIAFSHIENIYLSTVFPIEYTDINKKIVLRNLNKLNTYFEKIPVLVENITQYKLVNKNKSEGEFFKSISKQNDILLDITNLYVTAKSNKLDYDDYIKEFPLDKVQVLHISGVTYDHNNNAIDSHSTNINEDMLDFLARHLIHFKNLKYILVERDFNINKKEDILNDIKNLKNILHRR